MKQNLLLLHGALGSKKQFSTLKNELSTHFQVYDLDFEGHGENPSSKDFSIDLFSNNVHQFLLTNHLKKTNIFGYSMGGYVALNLALKHPELVEKIMTLGTKFAWTKEIAEKEIRMLNPEKIAEKVPAFAKKLATTHHKNDWKEVVNKTAKMMYDLGTGAKLTPNQLSNIQQKTLIGIGTKDQMVSIEESTNSADILPNGELKIIDDFQHPIEKIDEAKLVSILLDFLKN